MSRNFILSVIFVILGCVVVSSALGVCLFYWNSLPNEKAPYDIQGPAAVAAIVPSIFSIILAAISVYFFLYIEDPIRKEAIEIKRHAHLLSNQLQLSVSYIYLGVSADDEYLVTRGLQISSNAVEDFFLNTRAFNIISLSKEQTKMRENMIQYARSCAVMKAKAEKDLLSYALYEYVKMILIDIRPLDDIKWSMEKIGNLIQIDFEVAEIDRMISAEKNEKPEPKF